MNFLDDETAAREAASSPVRSFADGELVRRCRAVLDSEGGVRGHRIKFSPTAWQSVLGEIPTLAGRSSITRSDVFDIAQHVKQGRSPRDLFTASYIWGWGTAGFARHRYDRIVIAAGDDLVPSLEQALTATQDDLFAGYAQLYGGYVPDEGPARAAPGRGEYARLQWYGPAFFTKLLYFFHDRALILDNALAHRVHALGGPDGLVKRGRSLAWSPYRYAVYLNWMEQTASQLARKAGGKSITPEVLELALFEAPVDIEEEGSAAD